MFKITKKINFLSTLDLQIQIKMQLQKKFFASFGKGLINLQTKNYTYKPIKKTKDEKLDLSKYFPSGEKKPSLYKGDKVEILPLVGDQKNISRFERNMLKYKKVPELDLKYGTILKINRTKNTALVTNTKLEDKYVDVNFLGYYFESNRLKTIKQKKASVPISLNRLRLFSEITKNKKEKITSIKPAKIKYRNDPKNRVDLNNGKVFPVFLPTEKEINELRKKKHEEKKLTELDTQYDLAIKTTYKGENFEKITKNFIERIFNKNYIEKRLILNDK
jgi:hypothetical protein